MKRVIIAIEPDPLNASRSVIKAYSSMKRLFESDERYAAHRYGIINYISNLRRPYAKHGLYVERINVNP